MECVADLAHRVEYVHGSLGNVRDFLPAQISQRVAVHREGGDLFAVEVIFDRALHDRQRRLVRAQQHLEQRRFAAARLAGNAVDLAFFDLIEMPSTALTVRSTP